MGAVLVTHDHPDHAPGALPFAELVGAPLYACRLAGAESLRTGQRVRAGALDTHSRSTRPDTRRITWRSSSPAAARCSPAMR